jgi:hypothetical protein
MEVAAAVIREVADMAVGTEGRQFEGAALCSPFFYLWPMAKDFYIRHTGADWPIVPGFSGKTAHFRLPKF